MTDSAASSLRDPAAVDTRETLIAIDAMNKVYSTADGPVHALKDVSLEVLKGEFVALVGPSGCGKTTLLKILAGLVDHTDGSVELAGSTIHGPRDDVGIAFQGAVLLPWRRVIDNVLLPIELRHKPTDRDRQRAHELLDTVGLGDFAERYPSELSGGMQQRVSICRSLVHDPSFILLDEPFGALDALTREQLNVQLNEMWAGSDKTAILITHSISEAVFLAERVVIMGPRPGRILDIVPVPFGRHRSIDLLGSPEFADLTTTIRGYFTEEADHVSGA